MIHHDRFCLYAPPLSTITSYKEMVDYAASFGYGDTAGDIPMLMLCQHKTAVNPRKKLLKGLQGADGVEIVNWGK